MANTLTRDEIFGKVKQTLVDALSVDGDDVTEDATLMGDLGAESIDFLDIVFRLEKAFSIKIAQGELFPQDFFSNKEFVADGKFTAKGLQLFRDKYPFIDLNGAADLPVNKLSKLYTVQMLVNYIDYKKKIS